MNEDQLIEAWRRHRTQLRAEGAIRTSPIAFDAHEPLQVRDVFSDLFAFSTQSGDYTRELINFLNGWGYHIDCVASWLIVLEAYDQSDQIYLVHEFVGPLLEIVLGRPYQARSRIIYCATRLLELVAPHPGTERPPVNRRGMTVESLEKLIRNRREGPQLLSEVRRMNGLEFKKATAEFRNRLQHGLPPYVGQGIFWRIRRSYPDQRTTQTNFGLQPPISPAPLVPLLQNEHQAAVGAFDALWLLIQEVLGASGGTERAGASQSGH